MSFSASLNSQRPWLKWSAHSSNSRRSSSPITDLLQARLREADASTEFWLPGMDSTDTDDDDDELENSMDDVAEDNEPQPQQLIDTTTRRTSSSDRSTKHVSFSSATIYYHNTILGDSPAVSKGAPLALGNECKSTETWELRNNNDTVDDATACHCVGHTNWGGPEPLVIPAKVRTAMLLEAGVSESTLQRYLQFQCIHKKNPYMAARLYPDLA